MAERLYLIYCFTFPNGKEYIGQTCIFDKRMRVHKYVANKKPTWPVHYAINKYGWDNIKRTILCDNIDASCVDVVEEYFIKIFDTLLPAGYNAETGGHANKKISEETRAKLRGRVVSKEAREAVSKAHKGKHKSTEVKLKMSKAQKGRVVSDETRKKISLLAKERMKSPEKRKQISDKLKGHKISAYQKECLRKANTGRKKTQDEINKLREARKSYRPSKETIAKQLDTKEKRRKIDPNYGKIKEENKSRVSIETSERLKKLWQTEKYRENYSKGRALMYAQKKLKKEAV